MMDEVIKVEVMGDMLMATVKSHAVVEAMIADQQLGLNDTFHKEALSVWQDESIEDKHAGVAALMFNVPLEEVTAAMRRRGKAVNLGLTFHTPIPRLIKIANGEV